MSHTHWDGGPVCRFRTIKACDENWTQFQHGHLGYPCVKEFQPSKSKRGKVNTIKTCTIVKHPEKGESFRQNLQRQMEAAPQAWKDANEQAYNDRHARTGGNTRR